MKSMLTVALIAGLVAGPAYADCTPPNDSVSVPNGSVASRDDMIAAQKAVKGLDAAVTQYTACLKTAQDAETKSAEAAAGGDSLQPADKAKVAEKVADKYIKLQNAQVDILQKVANRFNTELKAYKAKNAS